MVIGLLIMTAVMYLLFMAGASIIWIPVIGPIVAPPIITMGITVFLAYIVSYSFINCNSIFGNFTII